MTVATESVSQKTSFKPLVSIVVNNFNYAHYLSSAIDSALTQTYSSTEVIVVDDGSTDDSRQVLSRYADRVRLVLQENKGQCQAANAGFSVSTGAIVIFLDADDMLMSHAVEQVVRLWEPGISKVHFRLQAIDGMGCLLPIIVPRPHLQEGELTQQLLVQGEYRTPPTSGNAFSREALDRVLPVPCEWPSKKALDKYLLHSTPFFGPVRAHQEPLGFYRLHGNNRSQLNGCDPKSISTMQAYLSEQLAVRALIGRTAKSLNLQIKPTSVLDGYTFRKNRLVLKRLGEEIAVLPEESLTQTTVRFIMAIWRCWELDFPSRLFLTGWAISVTYLPLFLAKKVIHFGMSASSRPAWLKKLIYSIFTRQLRFGRQHS